MSCHCYKPIKHLSVSENVSEALLMQFPDRIICNVSKIILHFSFRSISKTLLRATPVYSCHTQTRAWPIQSWRQLSSDFVCVRSIWYLRSVRFGLYIGNRKSWGSHARRLVYNHRCDYVEEFRLTFCVCASTIRLAIPFTLGVLRDPSTNYWNGDTVTKLSRDRVDKT